MAFLSGKDGFTTVQGVVYAFGKWKASIKTVAVKTSNFTSLGFDDNVEGFTGAQLTLNGPYDEGNMPLTSGQVYTFNLGWAVGISLQIDARVTGIDPSNDAEGTPTLDITAQSKGEFLAVIDGGLPGN